MNSFWTKTISLLTIIGILIFYNLVIADRNKTEEILRLKSELEQDSLQSGVDKSNKDNVDSRYKDGVYEGEAKGFCGQIKVQAVIEKGSVSELKIISAEGEDSAYFDTAVSIIDMIIDNQSADVDTISGATFSSAGIKNAAKQALGKAENKYEQKD
ncbi:MAG: FMN-binding protein [Ruminococcus sp.]|nr:FMN-binding protein [Ruminococcus sp.]